MADRRIADLDVLECLSAKLRVILQLSDAEINRDSPMIELGVDSLVAVEIRSLFMKELKVDVPVLKVIGGASLAELCQLALDKLPEGISHGRWHRRASGARGSTALRPGSSLLSENIHLKVTRTQRVHPPLTKGPYQTL